MITRRCCLPSRRVSETFEIKAYGMPYAVTVSRFEKGMIGKIFLNNHKPGSAADMVARDGAVIASLALQHGVPIDVLRNALLRDSHGAASGPLGCALDLMDSMDAKGEAPR
jgi:hypothetical protein